MASDLAKPWRHIEFRALWSASALSVIGDQLARAAVPSLVCNRTHSPALAALTYALTMLPNLISGVALGWLADRLPRRTIIVRCDSARAVLVAILAVAAADRDAARGRGRRADRGRGRHQCRARARRGHVPRLGAAGLVRRAAP